MARCFESDSLPAELHKYTRRKIKEGTCDEWKGEMFEGLMAERWMDEHTGGRKKSPI